MKYLNRYRVKQAKVLLAQGEKSITEVALESGFSSSAYFSRVFRSETGLTPYDYRQGKREQAEP
jgi:AraC-like DNA-binding protein